MLKVPDEEVLVIYGIDFSGAQDAGNKIWIAKGVPELGSDQDNNLESH